MVRTRVLLGFLGLGVALATSVPAQAGGAVQIDMSDAFNKDVIVNGTTLGDLDETQTTADISETSLITQGAAEVLSNCIEDPDGLANNGRFLANDDHPLVDLGYDNGDNGNNVRRSTDASNAYRIPVPHHRYRAMHVFATSANGQAAMRVKLIYRKGSSTELFIVRDWFGEPFDDEYALMDGLDRATPDASTCHDDDTVAIWGFETKAVSSKELRAVKITHAGEGDAVLNVFGMTGLRAGGN